MGILEKIAEIEKEISRTQKNKGKYMTLHVAIRHHHHHHHHHRLLGTCSQKAGLAVQYKTNK